MSNRSALVAIALAVGLVGCPPTSECDPLAGEEFCNDSDSGVVGVGNITLDPCDWDFGAIEPAHSDTHSFAIRNTGNGDLVVSSITLDAPFAAQATTPITIGDGRAYQFTVRFQPDTFGEAGATMTVTSDDPDTPTIQCEISGRVEGDLDGDGYLSEAAGGDDCDDEDPRVNPGVDETWYNGYDDNCDGKDDFDQDADGYRARAYFPDASAGGGDCQDANPDINPGAADEWYDGVDTNCDGRHDYDKDGDGYIADAYGGDDCDDEDVEVSPVGVEKFNGFDDDCDGVPDDKARANEADITLYGRDADDRVGHSVAAGDFNGNGQADFVVGWHLRNFTSTSAPTGDAYGAIAVFWDGAWSDGDFVASGSAGNVIDGAGSTDEFGYLVRNVGDFNGDGRDDVAVSAWAYDSRAGRVYLFDGADLSGNIRDAGATFTGEDDFRVGYGIGTDTDLDGDGADDLVVYGVHSQRTFNYLGITYGGAFSGVDTAYGSMDATWLVKCGPGTGAAGSCEPSSGGTSSTFGGSVPFAWNDHGSADFDGDGYDDLVIGDPYNDDDNTNAGRAWILWGQSRRMDYVTASLNATATTLTSGSLIKEFWGAEVGVVPDIDGDGDNELAVMHGDSGYLYLVEGGTDLDVGPIDFETEAWATLDFGSGGRDANVLTSGGDWTGDGVDELVFSFGEEGGSLGGQFLMIDATAVSGLVDGDREIVGSLVGGDDNQNFGVDVVGYDMNDDGTTDILASDWMWNEDDSLGSVHMFFNTR